MASALACRFSGWGPRRARLTLTALVVALWLASLASPAPRAPAAEESAAPVALASGGATAARRDSDLRLYDSVVERVAGGESFYSATLAEQRARSFPVRPAFAVRLPTLAVVEGRSGPGTIMLAAIVLLAGIGFAWWRRFGEEGAGPSERRLAVALILAGSSVLLNPYYHVLHELWAGGLIALSLGLHRTGRWAGALIVAALALAIRELALPFVLLMAALATWRRDWKEACAWGGLSAVFVAVLAWHHATVSAQWQPGDIVGPHWLALRGVSGWLGNLVQSSQLHYLPVALGGPVLVLALLGWTGRRTPAALSATLILLGYGFAFMIAGRDNNFYWGLIVTPLSLAGLAFLPRSLRALWRAAIRRDAVLGEPHTAGATVNS
jgi:hypothetical protein